MKKIIVPTLYLALLFYFWGQPPFDRSNAPITTIMRTEHRSFLPLAKPTTFTSKVTLLAGAKQTMDITRPSISSKTRDTKISWLSPVCRVQRAFNVFHKSGRLKVHNKNGMTLFTIFKKTHQLVVLGSESNSDRALQKA